MYGMTWSTGTRSVPTTCQIRLYLALFCLPVSVLVSVASLRVSVLRVTVRQSTSSRQLIINSLSMQKLHAFLDRRVAVGCVCPEAYR